MRPIEIVVVAFVIGAAICLIFNRGRWYRAMLLCSLLAIAAHAVFEGAHWQMIPAYVAAMVLCFFVRRPAGRSRFRIITGSLALFLVVATGVLSFLLPMTPLPIPTGPYPVGTTILYLKDSSRNETLTTNASQPRELKVQLWYPAAPSHNKFASYRESRETTMEGSYFSVLATNSRIDAPAATSSLPFPVILVSAGWRGRRTFYTFLTEELASQGYIVASIDHPYNANVVAFPDGRLIFSQAPFDIPYPPKLTPDHVKTIWDDEVFNWTADQSFVLNSLEGMNRNQSTPWYERIDTTKVGIIGHSFGSWPATEMCYDDARVRAIVTLDASYYASARGRDSECRLLGFMADPDQLAKGQPDIHTALKATLDAKGLVETADALNRFDGYAVLVSGSTHMGFADRPLFSPMQQLSDSGTVPIREVHSIVRTYAVAFFDRVLKNKNSNVLRSVPSRFPEVSFGPWRVGYPQ